MSFLQWRHNIAAQKRHIPFCRDHIGFSVGFRKNFFKNKKAKNAKLDEITSTIHRGEYSHLVNVVASVFGYLWNDFSRAWKISNMSQIIFAQTKFFSNTFFCDFFNFTLNNDELYNIYTNTHLYAYIYWRIWL